MPWREVSVVGERHEFVRLARMEGANVRELCRRFGISADIGYKWLKRWEAGDRDLKDRSRRPRDNPLRCSSEIEARVLGLRDAHPAWGARKIQRCLARTIAVPAVSTVHAILCRHGRIDHDAPSALRTYSRFEKEAPNLLWQMDFKGAVTLANGVRCHPLTMIDDHSRFSPCLKACANEQTTTVQKHMETTFRHYGLPEAIYVDNGSPWGVPGDTGEWTRLGVWLIKLGIFLMHSRPYHPQSRGKNERFHRTLKAEVFAFDIFKDLRHVQRAFDQWLEVYNFQRPHEAIGQEVPASRYQPSGRPMPARVPKVEYDEGEIVRTVPSTKAYISFKGRFWKVSHAFRGERVAIRPLDADGNYGIFFASHQIGGINLKQPASRSRRA